MFSKKIGPFWAAAVLLLTSMSWGEGVTATGKCTSSPAYDCRVNQLMLRMGSSSEHKNFVYESDATSWYKAKDTLEKVHELQEYGYTGDNGYVYMAFHVTSTLNGGGSGTGVLASPLPITDIILENFPRKSYPNGAPETIYRNGRMYKKLIISNNEDMPLNRERNRDDFGLWLYYTRDFIDGRAIVDIKVGIANATDAAKQELPSTSALSDYEIVKDGNGNAANLIAASNEQYGKFNYLYVKKIKMTLSDKPTATNKTIPYEPLGIPTFSWFTTTATNVTRYKVGNKYEDELWLIWNNFTEHYEPGTYSFYLKNWLSDPHTAPNVAGPYTLKVRKLTTADLTEAGHEQIKITNAYYSGEKLDVYWKDYCVAPGTQVGSNPPSDVKFYYSTTGTGSWTQFDVASKSFTSGTYYIKAYKPGNKYCEDINIGPVKITVKKSRIVIVKNNGQADVVIEQESNTPVTEQLPTLTKTGHTFAGWSGLDKWGGELPTTMPIGQTVATAQWNANSHKLTVDPNATDAYKTKVNDCPDDGDFACYSNNFVKEIYTIKYGSTIPSSYMPATLYRVGWTFKGWSGTAPSTMPDRDLSYTASWSINSYTLTFDTDGGSEVAPITQNYGTAVTKPSNPTKDGLKFAGWDPQFPTTMPAGNKTYKAKWDTVTVTITYEDGYSGKVLKTISEKYNRSLFGANPPADPTRTGYTFAGWDSELPSTMPAKDMTIKAKWNVNYFDVTFSDQLELVEPVEYVDEKLAYGTQLKLRLKKGYKILFEAKLRWWNENMLASTVACNFDADGVCTVPVDRNGKIVELVSTEDYGSIQILVGASEALIGYDTSVTNMITKPIEISAVTNAKKYTPNFAEVVMLPFDVSVRYIRGGIFCKFLGMEKSGFTYTARLMFVSTKLSANTPYLFVPTLENMTFKLPEGQTVIFKTSETPEVRQGDWVFRGNYNAIDWEQAGIENAYVFKGKESGTDGVNGSFVKATSGILHSMSGYLIQEKQAASGVRGVNGKVASKTMSIEELPDEINIRIENENGKTTALGTLNTRTGEMKIDRWFDVQGRLLKGKPTIKGVYYNNGKKVIVK